MKAPKTVKYYAVPRHHVVVCTTQRAASVSMIESLAPMDPNNTNMQILPARVKELKESGTPILLWVRDPYDRIACAYHIFGGNFISVDAFIENIIQIENPHWSPMTKLHRFNGTFLPTRVYPFEHLAETWVKELLGFPLQHVGANIDRVTWKHLEKKISDDNMQAIADHWFDDFALHRWAREVGVHEVAA